MGQARGGGVNKKRRRNEEKKEGIDAASGHSLLTGDDVGWWSQFTQRCNGCPPPLKGLDSFKSTLGISRKTFDYVRSLVKDDLMSKTGNFVFSNGVSLSIDDQVAIALRRLSTGDSLITTGDFFSVGHSTVFQVTWRFIEAMEERALHHLKWPSSEEEIQGVKSKFEDLCGLPNCCGAIDLTHIVMNLPTADPNTAPWLDEQERYSMVLQAIVDPEMRFLDIVTGWPGRMNEYAVLKSSYFDQLCEGEKLLGEESKLPDGSSLREYIVGDSGYPLLPYLITPYNGKEVPEPRQEFNKRQGAAVLAAQRALTALKDNWRIIKGVMWRPDRHRLSRVILVCCLLHNINIDTEQPDNDNDHGHDHNQQSGASHLHDPGYAHQPCHVADDTRGESLREKLCLVSSGRPLP